MLLPDFFELRTKFLLTALDHRVVAHDSGEGLLDLGRSPGLLLPQALQLRDLGAQWGRATQIFTQISYRKYTVLPSKKKRKHI